jgi:Uri superfamily endonuclease
MVHLCVEYAEDVAIPSSPGTYALILYDPCAGRIEVGKLGVFDLQPGWYVYAGSAFGPGGLRARCRRHRLRTTRPHWHIDYLRTVASVRTIWFTPDAVPREHQWVEIIGSLPEASTPIPRFGSSDCTCPSHLFRFSGRPSFPRFRRTVCRRIATHGPIMSFKEELSRQAYGNAL